MRRKALSFLLVMVLVTALAIAAIWTLITPMYRARAEVQIRPIIPRLVFHTDGNGPIPFYEGFVNTQVAIMRSPQVLDRVLDQTDVQRTEWYRNPGKSLKQRLTGQTDSPKERLKDALSVQPRRRTEIMDVSFSCAIAADGVVIANTVLDQYMKYVDDAASSQKNEEDRQREALYTRLNSEIEVLEFEINRLSQQLGTATPQERISAMRLNLDETEARIDELKLSTAMLEAQITKAGVAESNEVMITRKEEQPAYHRDVVWDTLYANIRVIRHQIATSRLDPEHPDMMQLMKYLRSTEELLRLREAQLDERGPGHSEGTVSVALSLPGIPELEGLLMSPKQHLAQAKQQLLLLEEQHGKDKTSFDGLFAIAQDFETQNIALRHKRELFDQVREVREHKRIESGVAGSIRVLTKAFAPSRPHNDHRIHLTAIAMGLLLVVAVGTAWLGRTPAGERSRK